MIVEFFTDDKGNIPVKCFLDSLSPKQRCKTLRSMALLKSNGTFLGMPHSKYIRDGIFELRTQFGGDINRILYFFYVDDRAVLTNGFVKKTQSIPTKELYLAMSRRDEYLRRHGYV